MSAEAGPAGRLVSLAMYVDPPAVRAATRALWAHLRDALRAAGFADVPDAADEAIAYDAAWLSPNLLLAQTCGYPFATRLRGRVRLVATPCYDHPGCSGAYGGSFIVVRAENRATSVADLEERRAAINDRASNSGYNLLRATIAPYARNGRFFADVIETGGHAASLAAIVDGVADVAAIDCVTWGNIRRHAPDRLAPLRILAETAKTPSLPLITRAAASDAEVTALRTALHGAAADPAMADTCATLGLRGFTVLGDADYDVVLRLERDAIALGYPIVA
ncbi:phosphate/phosphite/phosphonate ABC transporter substrate-binding protein [Sphingomonas profundi]|uniref:phosphate/phosphite/phosphonate ABC transporter substrate-binding protein n=1 Tax=Alterirhizorhabdus profundi TaxID=2681549 RepID=UPI0018D04909|nr:PhnD/SsuA/transferrin family substrate-binding protein [Sphingomonas profundi]